MGHEGECQSYVCSRVGVDSRDAQCFVSLRRLYGRAALSIRARRFFYLILVGLSAACGLVVEIVAGRMIAPYLGMSLYTWTAIIAVVLAGFSLGHWIGGQIAQRAGGRAQSDVAWSLLLAGGSALVSIFLIRIITGPVINLSLPPVATILIITFALFFLPSLFVGIASPVLTKLAIDDEPTKAGAILGGFYAVGAAGSILGTLAAGFIFISWLGTVWTLLLVSALYCVMAASLFISRRGGAAKERLVSFVILLGWGAVAFAGQWTGVFARVCIVESDYYCIRVENVSGEIGVPAKVLVLDHLAHGINLRDFPGGLVSPYADLQDTLMRIHVGERSPFRAFFIGGGAYTIPRAWLAARRDVEITVAEVDPAVTEVAITHLWLKPDPRLTIRHGDARSVLVSMLADQFDVVVGDAFHDITVPQHLVTSEFFGQVRSRLRDGGIYLMNVVDHREHPRMALSVVASLAEHFPIVELWRSDEAGERATFVVAGLAKATPAGDLPARHSEGVNFERLETSQMSRMLSPIVLRDDFAPVDRLIGVQ
ncbi:conserved membrane protein of unknown function [Candidatus Filomicrobium marinum]|uniref:PABS domain-containing protein n=1 Tax=Candidatus Filomicrobium marinum TaxID=1608628 RepID=A0A0D6JJT0_9HYPH|nr:conserved membrane protein of unknown function [Candidatus Filomicrobium marinum]CPR22249.1 conserved membrane protein of unknown function [Candidatus Filomicrobium marinum]